MMNYRYCRAVTMTFCIIVFSGNVAFGEVINVTVQELAVRELPAVEKAQVSRSLKRAVNLIKEVVGVDIVCNLSPPQAAEDYLMGAEQRLAPYTIPSEYSLDIFDANEKAIAAKIDTSCKQLPIDELRRLMQVANKEEVTTVDDLATRLFSDYNRAMSALASLKTLDGRRVLRAADWKRYSLIRWGVVLHSDDWADRYTLILTNAIFVDDGSEVNPLTWSHRGIANGFVLPASKLAAVSCYAILSDELIGGNRS